MDDEIIHSWCFHDVECFDSTPSTAIIILDEDLESFSSLRSQQSEIRRMTFTRSLLDTGASISILPKAVFNCHHVGELQRFFVELCLVDGSIRKSHGIVEDIIVRIEDCSFFVDFLVINIKMINELSQASIILGQPFLATAKAVTNWGRGEVILHVGEHMMKFNVNKLMKYPS